MLKRNYSGNVYENCFEKKKKKTLEAVATEKIATSTTAIDDETNNASSNALTKEKKRKRKKRKVDVADATEVIGANSSITQTTARTEADSNESGSHKSDSSRSDTPNETENLNKPLITPDGLYGYLGEGLGFKKLQNKRKRGHYIKRNTLTKKWATAMRRHWNSAKKDAAMAAITMKRCDMSTVWNPYLFLILCPTVRDSRFPYDPAGV